MTDPMPPQQIIPTDAVIADHQEFHYQVVILRDDQLELIRQIVREEIRAARGERP